MTEAKPRIGYDQGTLCAPANLPMSLQANINWQLDERSGFLRCDAMHYSKLLHHKETFKDEVAAWQIPSLAKPSMSDLREYQLDAQDAWMQSKRGVVVMPTGTGKTVVALSIISRLQCSALIICPLRALMYQWKQRLQETFKCKVGVLGDTHFHIQPITVTTYKSACVHMDKLGDKFELLVFDECHHLPGPVRADAARMSAAPYRLGLTATPERSDGSDAEYDHLIGSRVYTLPIEQVPKESLAQYIVKRIPIELTEDERNSYARLGKIIQEYIRDKREQDSQFEWQEAYAESASDLSARNALKAHRQRKVIEDRAANKMFVLEELLAHHADAQTVVFTGTNQMAYQIATRFLVPCLLDHCGSKERSFILDGFRSGKFKVIVANQVLDEGIDVPAAKIAIVLGGKATTRQAIQRLGRILRRSGDAPAILYEVVSSNTGEVQRSRKRRKTNAYKTGSHLPL